MTAQLSLITHDDLPDCDAGASTAEIATADAATRPLGAYPGASRSGRPTVAPFMGTRAPKPEPPAPPEVVRSKIAEVRAILEASRKRALERDERRQVIVVPAPVRPRPRRAA